MTLETITATKLDANLVCPSCGRDYEGDDELVEGDACPSDDCPSRHEELDIIGE